jgi:hypothetical protein
MVCSWGMYLVLQKYFQNVFSNIPRTMFWVWITGLVLDIARNRQFVPHNLRRFKMIHIHETFGLVDLSFDIVPEGLFWSMISISSIFWNSVNLRVKLCGTLKFEGLNWLLTNILESSFIFGLQSRWSTYVIYYYNFYFSYIFLLFDDYTSTNAASLYLHFATSVIHEITDALGIYCFR